MMDAPEEYGGLELDKASSMLVGEKMSYGGSFSVAFSAHTGIGTLPLIYYGTRRRRRSTSARSSPANGAPPTA
jgi:alkylation response protein AidB-like acyl-CoA dehydrogenase